MADGGQEQIRRREPQREKNMPMELSTTAYIPFIPAKSKA
jgi:hypothetical protein